MAGWNNEAWDWQGLRNEGQASRYRAIVKLIGWHEQFISRLVLSICHSLTGFREPACDGAIGSASLTMLPCFIKWLRLLQNPAAELNYFA